MGLIKIDAPVISKVAGFFISHGKGIHPDRTTDYFVLIFVRTGKLKIQEEKCAFTIQPHESFILRPYKRHWGIEAYKPDLSFYWMHFVPDKHGGPEKLSLFQHSIVERPNVMTEYFRRYLDDQENGKLSSVTRRMLATLLLSEVALRQKKREEDGNSQLAAQVDEYIAKFFNQPIGTSEIAQSLRFNADYLERLYHRFYGTTITQSIHRRRIGEARVLLRETHLNVNQIAHESGFTDVVYFRRIFKRQCGMTPLAFRKLNSRAYINTR